MGKVIFLDIDGVLCTARSHFAYGGHGLMRHLDPVAVKLVEKLSIDFGAKIVLSSTWRECHDKLDMTSILTNAGMSHVDWHQGWRTPSSFEGPRGMEINLWLITHGGQDCRYVIIDDDDDMLEAQKPYFVQTKCNDGLSWENYEQARLILT